MKPDYKKITQVLNYIAKKEGGEINYMKALKLLYLADRLHLRKYGRLITDDTLIAMKNGTLGSQARDIVIINENLPYIVYEYTKDKLNRKLKKYIIGVKLEDKNNLSQTDIECVDNVISVLGGKSEFDLVELTHKLPEWKRHQYSIETKEKLVVPVELEDLFSSTSDVDLNKVYNQTEEELSLSKDMFKESLEQAKCFA